jgi:hypothetical protein
MSPSSATVIPEFQPRGPAPAFLPSAISSSPHQRPDMRARDRPARACLADPAGKYHAAGPELHCRRHRRGGN